MVFENVIGSFVMQFIHGWILASKQTSLFLIFPASLLRGKQTASWGKDICTW